MLYIERLVRAFQGAGQFVSRGQQPRSLDLQRTKPPVAPAAKENAADAIGPRPTQPTAGIQPVEEKPVPPTVTAAEETVMVESDKMGAPTPREPSEAIATADPAGV